MPEGTWTCSHCGQIYSLTDPSCKVCHITREKRDVIGKISTIRAAKPPPEKVEVAFPFYIKEARFNLPLETGAVWSSGMLMFTPAGMFLLSERDRVDTESLAAQAPAQTGPVGPTSLFIAREALTRLVHHRLAGEFIEIQPQQKIPLRLSRGGWTDLEIICDQMGIARL